VTRRADATANEARSAQAPRAADMGAFRWEAVDGAGRVQQGLSEADTARAVRDELRAQGLTPTAVDAARSRGDGAAFVRLSPALLAMTTRQLATLTMSGMPLE